jgi:hypothetical protein
MMIATDQLLQLKALLSGPKGNTRNIQPVNKRKIYMGAAEKLIVEASSAQYGLIAHTLYVMLGAMFVIFSF